MSSVLADPLVTGVQQPRISHVAPFVSSAGQEAVDLAEMAGLVLDPWQALVLDRALGERADGRWAAFEVGVVVSRQNGKGALLEARELAGLFLLGERFITHSAHQFDTSLEAFRRLLFLIENTPDLSRRVKRVSRSHGEEGIELKGGQRIRFRTRTKGGGIGFSGDCLIFDEAMVLPEMAHGALLPTLSAQRNPQVWYTSSAVDRLVHDHGVVLARVRERGIAGVDRALTYLEWSPDCEIGDVQRVADDRAAWAQANPALGIRISEEHVANERRSMDPRTFAVQRLSVGDWPATDGAGEHVIDLARWAALEDDSSQAAGEVSFAVDVAPDRSTASIAAAGLRSDNWLHVEVVDRRRGTGWLVERLVNLVGRHGGDVALDAAGPAGSLVEPLERAGVLVRAVTAREHAQACGAFFDLVEQAALRHLGTQELFAAVRGAAKRPLGDAWAWSRKSSTVDISPLVAVTLAAWGVDRAVDIAANVW